MFTAAQSPPTANPVIVKLGSSITSPGGGVFDNLGPVLLLPAASTPQLVVYLFGFKPLAA